MAATPLLSLIKKGQFITFASSAEDIKDKSFRFSYFTCLDLPTIKPEQFGPLTYQNNMSFMNVEGQYIGGLNQVVPQNEANRLDFSESFQNYAMNLEAILTSMPEYDRAVLHNCAERIFFKWLKEVGCLLFQEDTAHKNTALDDKRFIELPNDSRYQKVIQYIGEVDMQGENMLTNENVFDEVYINIPSQNGYTPSVLFKSVADKNYNDQTIIHNPQNSEFIYGRTETQNPTTAGLTIEALYDMDVQYNALNYITDGAVGAVWYQDKISGGPNSYFTDTVFDDATTETIIRSKKDGSMEMVYQRSRLDGISIDFDVMNYQDIIDYNAVNDDRIVTFNQYNSTNASGDFEFNAICLYYDIDDSSSPTGRTTNLYGILFLNNVVSTGSTTSKIKPITKIRQDNFIGQQGNGFAIKLNFKLDVSTDLVDRKVEVSVNDYNTFSMSLFIEAVNNMVMMNRDYEKVLSYNKEIVDYNKELLRLVQNNDVPAIVTLMKKTEDYFTAIPDEKYKGLLQLIQKNQQTLSSILSGNASVDVTYIMNLRTYGGIWANFKNNLFEIGNSRQEYQSNKIINLDVSVNNPGYIANEVKLDEYTNLVVHRNNKQVKIAENNTYIYINDTEYAWKTNQTMRIIVDDPVEFGEFGILIYTDAKNNFGMANRYGKLVGVVDTIAKPNPVIKIICLDEKTYDFVVTVE